MKFKCPALAAPLDSRPAARHTYGGEARPAADEPGREKNRYYVPGFGFMSPDSRRTRQGEK